MKIKYRIIFLSVLMLFVLSCSFVPSLSSGGAQPTKTAKPNITQPTPPVLPEPPAPIPVPAGGPDQQAATLAQALADAGDNTSRLAAWLGVYQALSIPVIDESGTSLTATGDDPVGAPYWTVWYASGMDLPKRGMTLSDAGTILTAEPDGTFDKTAGQALLDDLRAAVKSKDAHVQLLGYFVRQRVLRENPSVDILDSQVKPEEIVIDAATVQLLEWALTRSTLYEIAKTDKPSSSSGGASLVSFVMRPAGRQALAGKPRCAELFGSEDTTAMVNWLMGKIYNGVSVPMAGEVLPGLTGTVLTQLGASAAAIKKIGSFTSRANAIGTLLSFYMQMDSLSLDPEITNPSGPLIRSKTTSDGARMAITWHLFYSKDKTPDSNELWACMTNFVTNVLGVGFSMPAAEGIGGAEITFEPGKNIPEKVLIDSSNPNYKIETDSKGLAVLKLIGRGQKKDLPDSAKPYDDTYTLLAYAQPEGETGTSLVNTFWDSLTFVADPAVITNAVAPVIDILKTLHYYLNEYEFLLTDWEKGGYTASGGIDTLKVSGTVCDLSQPFTLHGAGDLGGDYKIDFVPTDQTGGSYSYSGPFSGGSASGNGTYTVTFNGDTAQSLTMEGAQSCVVTTKGTECLTLKTVTPVKLTPIDSCSQP